MEAYELLAKPYRELKKDRKELGSEVLKELSGDFNSVKPSKRKSAIWNEELIEAYRGLPVKKEIRGRKGYLTKKEIRRVFESLSEDPVSRYDQVNRYDPEDRFGFCFGRAMSAYRHLINAGVSKDSIRRVWALGDMKWEGARWQHHVATMVRGKSGRWWVLDEVYGEPLIDLKTWYEYTKEMDNRGDLMLFVSDARRFGPADWSPIRPGTVKDETWNNYFTDMMKQSRAEAAAIREERKRTKLVLEKE